MDSGADLSLAVDLGRAALLMAVKLSLPALLAAFIVGGLIAVLQAATQVQEPTVNQVPKMGAIALVLLVAMPWFWSSLVDYTAALFAGMGAWLK